jgi:hypothetical protein
MRSRLCPDWASYERATRFKFSPDNFFDDGWNFLRPLFRPTSKLLPLDSWPHSTMKRSRWAHVASRNLSEG